MKIWLLKIEETQHQPGSGSKKRDFYGWDIKKDVVPNQECFRTTFSCVAETLFAYKVELAEPD